MSLALLDRKIRELRGRLGAKWSLVALLMPPALFGILHFGARAALVLAVAVLACMAFGIAGRALKGEPYQWMHPGSLISGLLIGLTCAADTPLYMLLVGAAIAELLGKGVLPGTHNNPFNPAVLGRAAIGLLEYFFRPLPETDAIASASVLFKEAGGHLRPDLWNAFWGLTPGAIGETSHFILLLVGIVLLRYVAVKWQAAVALLLTVPVVVLILPPTPEIVGHAPWVHNPLYYLLGGSTLFTALFFATDPKTIPNTRLGCVLFGAGVGVIGVIGKYYTDVPGFEMYGILVMNLLSPWLGRVTMKQATPEDHPAEPAYGVMSYYVAAPSQVYDKKPVPLGHTPRLDRHARAGRYAFLEKCLRNGNRDALLAAVQRSGLSGCGGGNLPISTKWAALQRTAGPRYLIVNALEGEPETFKDRYLLNNYAATVVEGVGLAAWALEVHEAIIVINAGYTECFAPVQAAVDELQSRFGDALRCKLVVMAGPDPELYIAGEETALIAYLEGRRAEPRDRPPHPTKSGLWGKPTVVHNVETLAWIPVVLGDENHLERQPQPRLISLTGAVARPGVYEAMLGESLAEIIAKGGGLVMNEPLQALYVGGVSGGLLPPSCIEMRFTPDALQQAGAMLGSGAIRVLSGHDNLLDETAKAMHFFREQSCGLCTPCRVGTQNLAHFTDRLSDHTLSDDGCERFKDMGDTMCSTSICGLGRRAPAPLQSLLRYWGKDEAVIKRLKGKQND